MIGRMPGGKTSTAASAIALTLETIPWRTPDVSTPFLNEKLAQASYLVGCQAIGEAIVVTPMRLTSMPTLCRAHERWPTHGAGSACGKALGAAPSTTVGYGKLFNWALPIDDEAAFVQALLAGQPEAPKQFTMMKKLNRAGPRVLHSQPFPEHRPIRELVGVLNRGATVIDTRPAAAFASAHLPGALAIPYDGSFTNWAGWLVGYESKSTLPRRGGSGGRTRRERMG